MRFVISIRHSQARLFQTYKPIGPVMVSIGRDEALITANAMLTIPQAMPIIMKMMVLNHRPKLNFPSSTSESVGWKTEIIGKKGEFAN